MAEVGRWITSLAGSNLPWEVAGSLKRPLVYGCSLGLKQHYSGAQTCPRYHPFMSVTAYVGPQRVNDDTCWGSKAMTGCCHRLRHTGWLSLYNLRLSRIWIHGALSMNNFTNRLQSIKCNAYSDVNTTAFPKESDKV